MPITSSATKKLRVDLKREAVNRPVLSRMKRALRASRTAPSKESITKAYSAIDLALKQGILKRRTASRLKSRLVASTRAALKTSPFGTTSVSKTPARATPSPSKSVKSSKK